MNKALLRQTIRQKLLNIRDKAILDYKIFNNLISLNLDSKNYFVYNSLDSEVDTKKIIEFLLDNNKTVYLPKIKNNTMYLVLITKETKYEMGSFNILEPIGELKRASEVSIDVTITPLLGYDKSLNRLGKRKGFYDRYFKNSNSFKIGLAYKCQEILKIDAETHDIKLDLIINEDGVLGESNQWEI